MKLKSTAEGAVWLHGGEVDELHWRFGRCHDSVTEKQLKEQETIIK